MPDSSALEFRGGVITPLSSRRGGPTRMAGGRKPPGLAWDRPWDRVFDPAMGAYRPMVRRRPPEHLLQLPSTAMSTPAAASASR